MRKLALGTVQFGLNYGIANRHGQVSHADIEEILHLARQAHVDTLDTAITYGDSETCLGDIGVSDFKIVTKLPPIPDGLDDVEVWIHNQMQASLSRLRVKQVYGLLLHRSQQLVSSEGKSVVKAIEGLKSAGFVEKIGVSIYTPDELKTVIAACGIDLIQAPMSLLDRRLQTTGWLARLKDMGIEIHARSVFLQGLLLMPRTSVPAKFARWQAIWDRWYQWLEEYPEFTPAQVCIRYVSDLPEIDRVVVGVDNSQQFKELLQADKKSLNILYPDLICTDEKILHPFNWVHL